MQQRTFKTYSKHTCNIHLQWGFHLNTLYFSSIGNILYHQKKEEEEKKNQPNKIVFKYIQKGKRKKKKDKSGNRKVFNLNPVPQRTNERTNKQTNEKKQNKKNSSINVALLQTMQKFTTLVFPHLINVTKVLHYKIGQL